MKRKKTDKIATLSIKCLGEADLAAATGGKMTREWCQKAADFEFWASYEANDCGRFE